MPAPGFPHPGWDGLTLAQRRKITAFVDGKVQTFIRKPITFVDVEDIMRWTIDGAAEVFDDVAEQAFEAGLAEPDPETAKAKAVAG